MDPGNERGRPLAREDRPATYTIGSATVAPAADIPHDPARWLRLHHHLYRRPRISAELDRLLSTVECSDVDDADLADEDYWHGDYWRETWMDRGMPEREQRGRELAAVGWCP